MLAAAAAAGLSQAGRPCAPIEPSDAAPPVAAADPGGASGRARGRRRPATCRRRRGRVRRGRLLRGGLDGRDRHGPGRRGIRGRPAHRASARRRTLHGCGCARRRVCERRRDLRDLAGLRRRTARAGGRGLADLATGENGDRVDVGGQHRGDRLGVDRVPLLVESTPRTAQVAEQEPPGDQDEQEPDDHRRPEQRRRDLTRPRERQVRRGLAGADRDQAPATLLLRPLERRRSLARRLRDPEVGALRGRRPSPRRRRQRPG